MPIVGLRRTPSPEETMMRSAIVKRSIVVGGHKTSVSLEDAFWHSLKQIGLGQKITLSALVAGIDTRRPHGNLSSAIRLFVLDYFRSQVSSSSTDRLETRIEVRQMPQEERRSHSLNGQASEKQ
jgi:predicted DNA-binding ribbon-helix-helix protein